jgi:hypothetical protein
MKKCPCCKKEKSLDYFGKNRCVKKDGLNIYCIDCARKKGNESRRKNPEAGRLYTATHKHVLRNSNYRRKYNFSLEEYNQMFIKQEGKCAICLKHQNEFKTALHVDHNHMTGKVRGLLCVICNSRIAVVENSEFMEKAKKFLDVSG